MAELSWLPLLPGEARCCFMGTQIEMIVLSNCERLTMNILKFFVQEYTGGQWYWSHACTYRKISPHQILLINKVFLWLLQWHFKTLSNYNLTELNSKTSSLIPDVFPSQKNISSDVINQKADFKVIYTSIFSDVINLDLPFHLHFVTLACHCCHNNRLNINLCHSVSKY